MSKTKYELDIQNRSLVRYYLGLGARVKRYFLFKYSRYIARKNGATIGNNVNLPISLARRANKNLIVGNNSSIQTDLLDLRAKIIIGENVIIGSGVEILTCSHNIDSPDWEFKDYGIEIEDFVWIATKVFVLPSCRKIKYGAVCGAGAVVVNNINEMSVVGGNPAKFIKERKEVHKNLVVCSLLGGDLRAYIKTRKLKKQS